MQTHGISGLNRTRVNMFHFCGISGFIILLKKIVFHWLRAGFSPVNISIVHQLVGTFQWKSVSKISYQLLVMSPVIYVCFLYKWGLVLTAFVKVIKRNDKYIIKQLLTIEVLDMTLISTTEYQHWPRLLPRSIPVFSDGYHVISNTLIVNNCILSTVISIHSFGKMFFYLAFSSKR